MTWHAALNLACSILGAGLASVGALILLGGEASLASPAFSSADGAPAWVWGIFAVAAGALTIPPRTRSLGLLLCAAWLCTWGVILGRAGLRGDTALYPIALYAMLVLHALLLLIVWRRAR